MTYRMGLAMARRGYLKLASSRPSQLAGFLSSHMALVVEIYKGTAGTGHFWIPTTPIERAYKAHPRGWLSVVNFWSWKSAEFLLALECGLWEGLGEALQVLKRDS